MRINRLPINDILVNIFLVLLFLLPQSMILFLTVPIGMLVVSNVCMDVGRKWVLYFLVLLLIFSFSLIVNISEAWVDTKSWLRALQLLVCFFCFGKTKSSKIYKETIAFIIIYLVVFQFAGILQIEPIVDLSYKWYPLSEKAELLFEQTLKMELFEVGGFNQRLFGIYHNANNCAIYLQIILIILLIEREQFQNDLFGKISYVVLLVLNLIGLIAAGSRTSFIVLILIGLTLFYKDVKKNFGLIILTVCIFIVLTDLGIDLRMFKVQDGIDSSFGIKIRIVEDYLKADISFFNLLFGCFSSQALLPLLDTQFAGTDFDIGDMFVQYGVLFVLFITIFLFDVFKSLRKENRMLFVIFFWMLSNTIICNYRTSSIVLFLLSIYLLRSQEKRKR